ncbi:hypothetical protein HDV05_004011 [Chytridiales sp. JEL 0842]|nr:hypothetical protein HDV05_004011 [Chytridiales sp. JEL 0842]
MPNKVVYVVIHSLWGHIKTLAEEIVKGLKTEEGIEVKLFRVAETLPAEVLGKMHAATFEDIPILEPKDLTKADGFIFGFGTRYGNAPAQIKAFWDATGQMWAKGELVGKLGGVFTSTASQHGGQETTIASFISHYVHHGVIYVPLGFTDPTLFDLTEVVGGSPWGAGTIAAGDGSRKVTAKELTIAHTQGKNFAKTIKRFN